MATARTRLLSHPRRLLCRSLPLSAVGERVGGSRASAARSEPRTKSREGLAHDRQSIAAHPQIRLEPNIPDASRRRRPRRT